MKEALGNLAMHGEGAGERVKAWGGNRGIGFEERTGRGSHATLVTPSMLSVPYSLLYCFIKFNPYNPSWHQCTITNKVNNIITLCIAWSKGRGSCRHLHVYPGGHRQGWRGGDELEIVREVGAGYRKRRVLEW